MPTRSLSQQQYLSTSEAAAVCGVTRNTICTWIREGRLASYQTVGGKNLIRPADLVAFMEKHNMFVPADLRLITAAEAPAGPPAASPAVSSNGRNGILVVDDLPDARKLAITCLKSLGRPIYEAESGYAALHFLLNHPDVAVVVLDVVMPGQLGTQTLREIRQQHPAIKVVIVTGYGLDGVRDMMHGAEPDAMVRKPYRPAELVDAARAFLPA